MVSRDWDCCGELVGSKPVLVARMEFVAFDKASLLGRGFDPMVCKACLDKCECHCSQQLQECVAGTSSDLQPAKGNSKYVAAYFELPSESPPD